MKIGVLATKGAKAQRKWLRQKRHERLPFLAPFPGRSHILGGGSECLWSSGIDISRIKAATCRVNRLRPAERTAQ